MATVAPRWSWTTDERWTAAVGGNRLVIILAVLFLPIPAFLIDVGLAFSIALSVLILMVALWIQRPLDFSSFPTILLIATMLRLSLNIATTRVILSEGHEGANAAGYVIGGFSRMVMSGDFVIGLIVFMILVVAMQSYAVNCSMTEALHPNMPAACYVPGAAAASARTYGDEDEKG